MATFKATLNNKPKADGTYTIMLRITENRKVKYVSLSEYVKKLDWNPNPKNGNYVRQANPSFQAINKRIEQRINEAKEKAGETKIKTSEAIKNAIKGSQLSFVSFFEKHLENIKSNPKAFGNAKKYNTIINKLKNFLEGKDLTFEEVDYDFLVKFKTFLFKDGNVANTVNSDLKYIRAVLYEAIRSGKYPQGKNPFFTFKLEHKRTYKEALTIEELQKIERLELPENKLIWHVKNCFLFSYYTHGMRVGDLITLKWKNIQDDRLIYQMSKTGESTSILLNQKALQVLSHYIPEKINPDNYIFPLLDNNKDYDSDYYYFKTQMSAKNSLLNKYLKKIRDKAEITKNLHFHISRHTFASIAREKIGDISKIQKFLGHSSIAITQAYLGKLTNKSLDTDSSKIYE
jgi:integrase